MQETIETIHATVALATRQGAAQAQISLEPAELGALRIHLTQTNEGLLARVSAETAAGAQAIASGQSELHSTLSSLGISLLRLDVGAFAQQEAHAGSQAPQQSQQRATRGGGLPDEAEEATTSTTTTTGTVSLSSNSALIDVLA
jgi:flagellar hook-length control protein FliK